MRIAFGIVGAFHPGVPAVEQTLFHPILLATWLGLLITSLNLMPAGQLDGGHILYSVSPRGQKVMTNLIVLLLIVGGAFYWLPWLVWAFVLMILAKHPSVPMLPEPDGFSTAKYVTALVLFLLTFHYMPFVGYHGDKGYLFSLIHLPQILTY
jgi:membrane-associated protease RseP (regulator of RpoE activity)